MKMVSTRGVKFKFEKSEKVLCYEPDPTKARVLYESKVLEVGIKKDKQGKKSAEYLIHFNGWNSSWDRCVTEELILEDTAENRRLQRLLAQEAALKLRDKKKKRLIESAMSEKNRRNKCVKHGTRHDTNGLPVDKEQTKRTQSCGNASKLTILEKLLRIPDALVQQLENDFTFIKKTDKLVQLPCEPNVVFILEDYIQNFIENSLHAVKNSDEHVDCVKRLNLCKEVLDGLRIYFDFTLPSLLLYNSEMKQYEYFSKNFKPKCSYKESTGNIEWPLIDNQSVSSGETGETIVANNLDTTSSSCFHQDVFDASSSSDTCDAQSIPLTVKSEETLHQLSTRVGGDSECSSVTSICANSTTQIIPNTINTGSSLTRSAKHLQSSCRCCRETIDWNLLPVCVYESIPPVPSVIYGAQHLLRLFVKLPELLSRTTMPKKQLKILGKHLQKFLRYMAENRNKLFRVTAYVDHREDFASTDSTLVR